MRKKIILILLSFICFGRNSNSQEDTVTEKEIEFRKMVGQRDPILTSENCEEKVEKIRNIEIVGRVGFGEEGTATKTLAATTVGALASVAKDFHKMKTYRKAMTENSNLIRKENITNSAGWGSMRVNVGDIVESFINFQKKYKLWNFEIPFTDEDLTKLKTTGEAVRNSFANKDSYDVGLQKRRAFDDAFNNIFKKLQSHMRDIEASQKRLRKLTDISKSPPKVSIGRAAISGAVAAGALNVLLLFIESEDLGTSIGDSPVDLSDASILSNVTSAKEICKAAMLEAPRKERLSQVVGAWESIGKQNWQKYKNNSTEENLQLNVPKRNKSPGAAR